jgi:hypothetical protein
VPPPTDHGVVEPFWYSFDLTHRRVQEGGWNHQVTSRELPVSKEVAGVNVRLTKGSFRELHWHLADEWALIPRLSLAKQAGHEHARRLHHDQYGTMSRLSCD